MPPGDATAPDAAAPADATAPDAAAPVDETARDGAAPADATARDGAAPVDETARDGAARADATAPEAAPRFPEPATIEAYARAAADLKGLNIDDAWWPGVLRHLEVLLQRAASLEGGGLNLPDDPAPVFQP